MGSNAEFQNRSTLRLRLYIACLKRSSPDTPSLETPEWACELLENLSFPSLCSKSKVLSQQVIPSEKAVVKGFEEGMGFFHWDLPRFSLDARPRSLSSPDSATTCSISSPFHVCLSVLAVASLSPSPTLSSSLSLVLSLLWLVGFSLSCCFHTVVLQL